MWCEPARDKTTSQAVLSPHAFPRIAERVGFGQESIIFINENISLATLTRRQALAALVLCTGSVFRFPHSLARTNEKSPSGLVSVLAGGLELEPYDTKPCLLDLNIFQDIFYSVEHHYLTLYSFSCDKVFISFVSTEKSLFT